MGRLLDLYLGGRWDLAELDRRKAELTEQLARARKRREELRSRLAAADLDARQVQLVVGYFATLANAERWMTPEQLHRLLAAVFPPHRDRPGRGAHRDHTRAAFLRRAARGPAAGAARRVASKCNEWPGDCDNMATYQSTATNSCSTRHVSTNKTAPA